MLKRALSSILLVLCGGGLLVAWTPERLPWYIFQALVFSLFLVWAAAWALGKLEVRWTWLFPPLAFIACWGIWQLHMGWSVYAYATHVDVIRWCTFLVVFFLAVQLFPEVADATRFRQIFTIYALVVTVVSVLQHFLGNGKIYWMFEASNVDMGPILNRDHYASFIALAIPPAAVEMVKNHNQRWFFAIAMAAMYASVIASASRAGSVLVTLEVLVLFVLLRFSGPAALAVGLLIATFGLVVGWGSLIDRFYETDPYQGRREVATASVHMFQANPWKGWGLDTWTTVYPEYALKDFGPFINAAHNDWLQWGVEGGVPMLACLAVLFGASLLLTWKIPWVLGVPVVFIHCMIDFPMQGRFLPVIFFLVFGIAVRAGQQRLKPQR